MQLVRGRASVIICKPYQKVWAYVINPRNWAFQKHTEGSVLTTEAHRLSKGEEINVSYKTGNYCSTANLVVVDFEKGRRIDWEGKAHYICRRMILKYPVNISGRLELEKFGEDTKLTISQEISPLQGIFGTLTFSLLNKLLRLEHGMSDNLYLLLIGIQTKLENEERRKKKS